VQALEYLLAVGYDHIGSLKECLGMGIGVGKSRRANGLGPVVGDDSGRIINISMLMHIVFILIFVIVGGSIYYFKPKFIMKDEDERNEIDWVRFSLFLISLLLTLILIRNYFKRILF
jgi:hypothetical protein